jgi:hypothetical protein
MKTANTRTQMPTQNQMECPRRGPYGGGRGGGAKGVGGIAPGGFMVPIVDKV